MTDAQAIAIIASNLLGKSFERIDGGFTIVVKMNSMPDALVEAVKLYRLAQPTY